MKSNSFIQDVQKRILEIMEYIDIQCRNNGIEYYIMGGTALGAVRHGGFIPWDDDLDIFMTPQEYRKFKAVFEKAASDKFVLQEWSTVEGYLEYAKVRMNGTTFIEDGLKDRRDLHHGIYVDIMILHKVPDNKFIQKCVFYASKFVTLYGLSQRNWKPKTKSQAMVLNLSKLLPRTLLAKLCYRLIYKYDGLQDGYKYCYWITPAGFRQGLFEPYFFSDTVEIPFEHTTLYGSRYIKEYLKYRYGDYMALPPIEKQLAAVHAMIYDVDKDYSYYIN